MSKLGLLEQIFVKIEQGGMSPLYMGDALPEDRYLSPVLADFDGLPPILGQVGSTEILLDDTVRAGELDELPFRYGRSKARQ